MGDKKRRKKHKQKHEDDTQVTNEEQLDQDAKTKLTNKDYEAELRKLHVELVKLQEWVRHEGRKICILFEGRDGAGKGGTIKAITARVSPRIFESLRFPRRPSARNADVRAEILAALAGRRRSRDLRPQLV